jgi:hypothetical protein
MKYLILYLTLLAVVLSMGCVATTKVVVTHKPQDDLTYTVTREWKRTF